MQRVEDCIHFLLGKALQKVTQVSKVKLHSFKITPVQFALLHILWENDGQSGAKLGERLRLDAATVTGIVDRLEQKGFIERRADPHDRRNKIIFLTEKGAKLETPLNQKMDEISEEVLHHFTEMDILLLKQMLGKIGELADRSP